MTEPQRRISDIVVSNPWPDAERVRLDEIAGIDINILEAREAVVNSKFAVKGKHRAYFLLLQGAMGEQYQLLVSQQVLMDKLDQVVAANALPLVACFQKNGQYWDVT